MKTGWRQETFVGSPEGRGRVMAKLSGHGNGGIDLQMWQDVKFSKLESWGHWLLSVSSFRWRRREDPAAMMEAPFSLFKVPFYPENFTGMDRFDRHRPAGLSFVLLLAWKAERALDLSVPCPVTRWAAMQHYSNNTCVPHFDPGWEPYIKHRLHGISPVLDGYYKEYRRHMRKIEREKRIQLAMEHV